MITGSLKRSADLIETITISAGRIASTAYLLLILVVIVNVVLRYFFSRGMIELEEVQWHLYSIGFLIGLAWTHAENEHVRVDIFHQYFSYKLKAVIDLIGGVVLLASFSFILFYFSISFVENSWAVREGSDNPSGLPARYVIKTVMSVGLALLSLQSVASILRNICHLLSPEKLKD
ncbi:MAG: TRAP transporter small permease subunit [Sneathiella sp.]